MFYIYFLTLFQQNSLLNHLYDFYSQYFKISVDYFLCRNFRERRIYACVQIVTLTRVFNKRKKINITDFFPFLSRFQLRLAVATLQLIEMDLMSNQRVSYSESQDRGTDRHVAILPSKCQVLPFGSACLHISLVQVFSEHAIATVCYYFCALVSVFFPQGYHTEINARM